MWDHPRTRGEKFYQLARTYGREGSPPHTRGKVYFYNSEFCCRGITPAHAGKSILILHSGSKLKDHPRTRGEKASEKRVESLCRGSPPHTRGKVTVVPILILSCRITPAHAGKSCSCLLGNYARRDHPRTRGEKSLLCMVIIALLGSPPHTRGKAFCRTIAALLHRITPAHAGKSPVIAILSYLSKDHPRTRGEKSRSFRF